MKVVLAQLNNKEYEDFIKVKDFLYKSGALNSNSSYACTKFAVINLIEQVKNMMYAQ